MFWQKLNGFHIIFEAFHCYNGLVFIQYGSLLIFIVFMIFLVYFLYFQFPPPSFNFNQYTVIYFYFQILTNIFKYK